MGQVWKLIEQHQRSQPYEPSIRSIAKAAGVKESTLPKWQNLSRLPAPENLRAVARHIHVPYRVLLEAALTDTGYLEEISDGTATNGAGVTPADEETSQSDMGLAARKVGRKSRGQMLREQQDREAESGDL